MQKHFDKRFKLQKYLCMRVYSMCQFVFVYISWYNSPVIAWSVFLKFLIVDTR